MTWLLNNWPIFIGGLIGGLVGVGIQLWWNGHKQRRQEALSLQTSLYAHKVIHLPEGSQERWMDPEAWEAAPEAKERSRFQQGFQEGKAKAQQNDPEFWDEEGN